MRGNWARNAHIAASFAAHSASESGTAAATRSALRRPAPPRRERGLEQPGDRGEQQRLEQHVGDRLAGEMPAAPEQPERQPRNQHERVECEVPDQHARREARVEQEQRGAERRDRPQIPNSWRWNR
ncbi:MAG: hypothetical protein E6J87_08115 [Deltaproteobacteria bacterium]|nr:MAG: hypothetical protein E6J87_08115 [Deltaproteobacteria bacterium]